MRISLVFGLVIAVIFPSQSQATPKYLFPIQGCSYSYARAHHNYPATDILTKIGCDFVAPISGTIDEVNRIDRFKWATNKGVDRGGLMISMIGDDGVRYYGSHLSSIPDSMITGLKVAAGDVIGETGNSGDAKGTAPHLHFGISWATKSGIWWVRRGELYPWPFLDAWKKGKDLSPFNSIKKLEAKIGNVPPIPAY